MIHMSKFFQFEQINKLVFRLGLATRGNTHLSKDDVLFALEQGLNYWNWCGHEDGMAQAVRTLGLRRNQIVFATQLSARDSKGIQYEVEQILDQLETDYLDIATLYYVEQEKEWKEIMAPLGAFEGLRELQDKGKVKMIGLTTHQRHLAAQVLNEDHLDLLMTRYNAAHRGAEEIIFPVAQRSKTPIVAFTALRWQDLLKNTPEDPVNFSLPLVKEWYRFSLSHPAVSIVLSAPDNRSELLKTLELLADWRLPTVNEFKLLRGHGDRVYKNGRRFI